MKLWIRLDVDSPRDPRIGRLAELLKLTPRHVFGMLVAVWCAMGEHAQDGDLLDVSDATLEEWAGAGVVRSLKPGEFAAHFSSVFLDGQRCDPYFRECQGKLVEKAQKDRDRMVRNRQPVREGFANNSRTTVAHTSNGSALRHETEPHGTDATPLKRGREDARSGGTGRATKGHAMKVFAEIRQARVANFTPGGTRYHIPKDFIEALDTRTHAALDGVGGAHLVASAQEEKLTILRSQFAEIYLATQ